MKESLENGKVIIKQEDIRPAAGHDESMRNVETDGGGRSCATESIGNDIRPSAPSRKNVRRSMQFNARHALKAVEHCAIRPLENHKTSQAAVKLAFDFLRHRAERQKVASRDLICMERGCADEMCGMSHQATATLTVANIQPELELPHRSLVATAKRSTMQLRDRYRLRSINSFLSSEHSVEPTMEGREQVTHAIKQEPGDFVNPVQPPLPLAVIKREPEEFVHRIASPMIKEESGEIIRLSPTTLEHVSTREGHVPESQPCPPLHDPHQCQQSGSARPKQQGTTLCVQSSHQAANGLTRLHSEEIRASTTFATETPSSCRQLRPSQLSDMSRKASQTTCNETMEEPQAERPGKALNERSTQQRRRRRIGIIPRRVAHDSSPPPPPSSAAISLNPIEPSRAPSTAQHTIASQAKGHPTLNATKHDHSASRSVDVRREDVVRNDDADSCRKRSGPSSPHGHTDIQVSGVLTLEDADRAQSKQNQSSNPPAAVILKQTSKHDDGVETNMASSRLDISSQGRGKQGVSSRLFEAHVAPHFPENSSNGRGGGTHKNGLSRVCVKSSMKDPLAFMTHPARNASRGRSPNPSPLKRIRHDNAEAYHERQRKRALDQRTLRKHTPGSHTSQSIGLSPNATQQPARQPPSMETNWLLGTNPRKPQRPRNESPRHGHTSADIQARLPDPPSGNMKGTSEPNGVAHDAVLAARRMAQAGYDVFRAPDDLSDDEDLLPNSISAPNDPAMNIPPESDAMMRKQGRVHSWSTPKLTPDRVPSRELASTQSHVSEQDHQHHAQPNSRIYTPRPMNIAAVPHCPRQASEARFITTAQGVIKHRDASSSINEPTPPIVQVTHNRWADPRLAAASLRRDSEQSPSAANFGQGDALQFRGVPAPSTLPLPMDAHETTHMTMEESAACPMRIDPQGRPRQATDRQPAQCPSLSFIPPLPKPLAKPPWHASQAPQQQNVAKQGSIALKQPPQHHPPTRPKVQLPMAPGISYPPPALMGPLLGNPPCRTGVAYQAPSQPSTCLAPPALQLSPQEQIPANGNSWNLPPRPQEQVALQHSESTLFQLLPPRPVPHAEFVPPVPHVEFVPPLPQGEFKVHQTMLPTTQRSELQVTVPSEICLISAPIKPKPRKWTTTVEETASDSGQSLGVLIEDLGIRDGEIMTHAPAPTLSLSSLTHMDCDSAGSVDDDLWSTPQVWTGCVQWPASGDAYAKSFATGVDGAWFYGCASAASRAGTTFAKHAGERHYRSSSSCGDPHIRIGGLMRLILSPDRSRLLGAPVLKCTSMIDMDIPGTQSALLQGWDGILGLYGPLNTKGDLAQLWVGFGNHLRENKLAASVRMLLPINDEPQHLRLIFMHPKQTTAKILARSFTEVVKKVPKSFLVGMLVIEAQGEGSPRFRSFDSQWTA